MAKKPKTKPAPKPKKTTRKPKTRGFRQELWLRYYLDETNPETFLNKTRAAMAAGYKGTRYDSFGQIGYLNFKKFQAEILEWLDEYGLSETALKIKLKSLIDAKEDKIITVKGVVEPGSLPGNVRVIGTAETERLDKSGQIITQTETVLLVKFRAIETQRRTLDMALKVKGLYAPEKHDVTVEDKLKNQVAREILDEIADSNSEENNGGSSAQD